MYHINIAIIGSVSVGKSTLLNTLFVNQYSDTKITTTKLPQIYTESDEDFDEKQKINNQIDMTKMTVQGKILHADIKEIHHKVPRTYDFVKLRDEVFLQIYDLSGLDNSNVCIEYVEKNFYKYNILIYVLDITYALNRSSEVKILDKILRLLDGRDEKHRLIFVFNKCDDMCKINGVLMPTDDELIENKNRTISIINSRIDKMYHRITCEYVMMSCDDAYIYRTLHKNPGAKLDSKYVDKFGSDEVGKFVWKETQEDEKVKIIKKLLSGDKRYYEERIEMTGFNELKKLIAQSLTSESQSYYMTKHIIDESARIDIEDYRVDGYTHAYGNRNNGDCVSKCMNQCVETKGGYIKNRPRYIICTAIAKFHMLKIKLLKIARLFGKTDASQIDYIFRNFMVTYANKYSCKLMRTTATLDTIREYMMVIRAYEHASELPNIPFKPDYLYYTKLLSMMLNQCYIDELEKTEHGPITLKYFAELCDNKHIGGTALKYLNRIIAKINLEKTILSEKNDKHNPIENKDKIIEMINNINVIEIINHINMIEDINLKKSDTQEKNKKYDSIEKRDVSRMNDMSAYLWNKQLRLKLFQK